MKMPFFPSDTRTSSRGFTVVELAVVIVVIAILAAIVLVSYNGVQDRALDNTRSSDMASIEEALELFRFYNGRYPYASGSPGLSGWELSTDTANTWLTDLRPYLTTVPTDPVNEDRYSAYYYYYYPPGNSTAAAYGCPSDTGFYVLQSYYASASNMPKSKPVDFCTSVQAAWTQFDNHWVSHGRIK